MTRATQRARIRSYTTAACRKDTQDMAKKKRRGEIRKVPLADLTPGPICHKKGLTPVLEELARSLFSKVGRFVYPTFEQWELGFMRDEHPWREILIWENIARTFNRYLAEHPDADGRDVVGTICSISAGHVSEDETETEKELRSLFKEAYEQRWLPPSGEPFEFPSEGAPVLEYRDVVDERDGAIWPNIRGEIDPRRLLADADIILGMDSKSGKVFHFFGGENLLEDGGVPDWLKTAVVRLDPENKKTQEVEKMCFVVEKIKGRHDFQ